MVIQESYWVNLDNPIIILAYPRSGSSMTAGLFAAHGVWVGTSRGGNENNPKGFFEHTHIKQLLKKRFGWDLMALSKNPPQPIDGFYGDITTILEKDGWNGEQWLCKHSALYWRAWSDFKPKFILVRRDIEQTVRSNISVGLHRGEWTPKQLTEIMQAHHREMDILSEYHDGKNVYTDELIKGDYSSLESAMAYCGIVMKEEIVKDFIEPKYWKHHAGSTSKP